MTVQVPAGNCEDLLYDVRVDVATGRTPHGHGRLEPTKFHTPTAVSAEPNAPANTLGIRPTTLAVEDIEDALARPDHWSEGRLGAPTPVASQREEPLPVDTEARSDSFTELVATAIVNTESRAALARLAEEQAALRRVATLVVRGVPQEEVFTTVAEEVGAAVSLR